MDAPPRTLLVLGGTGFLGAHVCAAASLRWRVVAAARRPELPPGLGAACAHAGRVEARAWDALAPGAVRAVLDAVRPDAVLGAFALSRLASCERLPELARVLNAELPGLVAEACRARGLRYVHVSTDLVFGGAPPRGARYAEEDPPRALSLYGATKGAGEEGVRAADPAALVVRLPLLWGDSFGRGLGASGALFAALERGETPALFVDEFRTPLDAGNAARALLELVAGEERGLLHLAGPERLSRHELARLLLGGRTDRIRAVRRAELGLERLRPADASLDATRARTRLETPLLGPTRALHGGAGDGRAGAARA